MKHTNKLFIILSAVLLLCVLLAACTPDTPVTPDDGEHVHEYENWKHNSYNHWQECDCGANLNYGEHSGGTATYDTKPICEVCGAEYGTHLHQYGEWKSNGYDHWKECACGATADKGEHTGGTATYDSKPLCEICGTEYGTHLHQGQGEWETDGKSHWRKCSCGEIADKGEHTGGAATYESKPVCEVCGAEYGEHLHKVQGKWLYSEEEHWKECSCGKAVEPEDHILTFDKERGLSVCEICGYIAEHVHSSRNGWHTDHEGHWQICFCGQKYNYGSHGGGQATTESPAVCETCGREYGTVALPDIEGMISGYEYDLNYYVRYVRPNNFNYITSDKVADALYAVYQPQYWINYLQKNGYPQTYDVKESGQQIVYFVENEGVAYPVLHLDIQYTAYDKNGNVIEFSEKDGKNPVGDMLKEKFSTVYDTETGKDVEDNTLSLMGKALDGDDLTVGVRMGFYGQTYHRAKLYEYLNSWSAPEVFMLRDGEFDIVFSYPVENKWRESLLNDSGIDLVEVPVGRVALVFFVNADNPVEELTAQQIKDIYSGKITNWKEVGGNDAPIKLFQADETATVQRYLKHFMGEAQLLLPTRYKTPNTMGEGLDSLIANYDNSINSLGFNLYSSLTKTYVDAGKIKLIKVNGIAPDGDTLSDLTYPLLEYVYATYDKNNKDPEIEKMINWILSDEGQKVVADSGYIPLDGGDGSVYSADTGITLYETVGSGRESSSLPQNGRASTVTVPVNMEYPENYLETSPYYWRDNDLGAVPFVFGIKYTVDGLVNEELEGEINDFIASAVEELELKFSEMYEYVAYEQEYVPGGRGIMLGSSPVSVSVKGKNGYLSVVVALSFYRGGDDPLEYRYDVRTATYDLRTGEKIESLSDLFPQGVDFLDAFNQEIEGGRSSYGFHISEEEARFFTYDRLIIPIAMTGSGRGRECRFHANSLATEYCDMTPFFTKDFEGNIIDGFVRTSVIRDRFVSIENSKYAGVFIPSFAEPTFLKAAENLVRHLGQYVSESLAVKLSHEAGYTAVASAEHVFPQYIAYKFGNMFYAFYQADDVYDNVYYFYDADGNSVQGVRVDPRYVNQARRTYYFWQDTGEPVKISLKEGWEKVSVFMNLSTGMNMTYDEIADHVEEIIAGIDFFTGTFNMYIDFDENTYARDYMKITIPKDYIILE